MIGAPITSSFKKSLRLDMETALFKPGFSYVGPQMELDSNMVRNGRHRESPDLHSAITRICLARPFTQPPALVKMAVVLCSDVSEVVLSIGGGILTISVMTAALFGRSSGRGIAATEGR